MFSINGNSKLLGGPSTLVILQTSVMLECRKGRGHACIFKAWEWPGVPQTGVRVIDTSPGWPFCLVTKTLSVNIPCDPKEVGTTTVLVQAAPMRGLRAIVKHEDGTRYKLNKEFFCRCLDDLIVGGWQLTHLAKWQPITYGEVESLYTEQCEDAADDEEK